MVLDVFQRFASWRRKPIKPLIKKRTQRLKYRRGRNGTGIVLVRECPVCGDEYTVRRGRNNDKGETTRFDPGQCGRHLRLKEAKA